VDVGVAVGDTLGVGDTVGDRVGDTVDVGDGVGDSVGVPVQHPTYLKVASIR